MHRKVTFMLRLFSILGFFVASLWGADPLLIVLHKGGSSLGFYSTAGKRLADVPVGRHPHEMALSPDRRLAYITDNGTMRIEQAGTGGNTISIVDLVARKKIGEISLGKYRRPHGIDLHAKSGSLAVSTELPDQLLIIDADKRQVVKTYETKGKTSHMVAWGPEARWAYVSNSSSANVAAIETATGRVKLIPTGERPEGSVLSPDGGRLYVANREAQSITIIDTAKQEAVGEVRTGEGPVRISCTPDGRQLVYALLHEKKVEFADPASRQVLGQVPLGGRPVSLKLSPDGKQAFASAEEDDTVFVISVPERKILRQFKTAPGAGPDPVLEILIR
jgi:YVTN family beta-propeller protein